MDGVDPLLEGGDHPQRPIALGGIFRRHLDIDALDQNRLWNQRRRRIPQYYRVRDHRGRERRRLELGRGRGRGLSLSLGDLFRRGILDGDALDRNRESDWIWFGLCPGKVVPRLLDGAMLRLCLSLWLRLEFDVSVDRCVRLEFEFGSSRGFRRRFGLGFAPVPGRLPPAATTGS